MLTMLVLAKAYGMAAQTDEFVNVVCDEAHDRDENQQTLDEGAESETLGGRIIEDASSWPEPSELKSRSTEDIIAAVNESPELDIARNILLDTYEHVRERKVNLEENSPEYNGESQRRRIKNLKQLIALIEDEQEEKHGRWENLGTPIDEIIVRATRVGLDKDAAKEELEKLRKKGEVYEPRTDHLRTT